MGRLQLSFLYALSAVGFTAPESGMHIRAYMTKYVRIPAHFCTFKLKNLNGPSRWPGQLEYTKGLIEVNTREDSLNRGLIEVLWRQRVHRDWATALAARPG